MNGRNYIKQQKLKKDKEAFKKKLYLSKGNQKNFAIKLFSTIISQ